MIQKWFYWNHHIDLILQKIEKKQTRAGKNSPSIYFFEGQEVRLSLKKKETIYLQKSTFRDTLIEIKRIFLSWQLSVLELKEVTGKRYKLFKQAQENRDRLIAFHAALTAQAAR